MKNLLSCGGQNHLGPFILIFLEVFVASRRFFQGKAVADEEFSVDLTLSDTVEKIVAIALHMRLAALHLQSFFHDGAQRELVSHAAINAELGRASCRDRVCQYV